MEVDKLYKVLNHVEVIARVIGLKKNWSTFGCLQHFVGSRKIAAYMTIPVSLGQLCVSDVNKRGP